MGILRLEYGWRELTDGSNFSLPTLEFNQFDDSLLGLGDKSGDGECFEAVAVVFDLEGFTSSCNQPDPHLIVPEYLRAFLKWLFGTISARFVQDQKGKTIILWSQLPFFAKFLGDG